MTSQMSAMKKQFKPSLKKQNTITSVITGYDTMCDSVWAFTL